MALCLSLAPRALPRGSPAWTPPAPGDRRRLELFFVERDAAALWEKLFAPFGPHQAAAGMGEVAFAAGFVPTVPGTDFSMDEI